MTSSRWYDPPAGERAALEERLSRVAGGGFSWRGPYDAAAAYAVHDAVSCTANGVTASYINLVGSTGIAPPAPTSGASSETWGLLASGGAAALDNGLGGISG